MWCPKCQIEKEVSQTETQTFPVCEICHSVLTDRLPELEKNRPEKSSDAAQTSHAHELLQRWSDQRLLSPSGKPPSANEVPALEGQTLPEISESHLGNKKPTPKQKKPKQRPAAKPVASSKTADVKEKPARKTVKLSEHLNAQKEQNKKRVEKPPRKTISISERPAVETPSPTPSPKQKPKPVQHNKPVPNKVSASKPTPSQRNLPNRSPRPQKSVGTVRPRRKPEYDVQAAIREQIMKQKSWLSAIGNLFSYGGALLLAGGAGLTLYSYFGKSVDNIPTEYLITTIGQLFLFAGLVMLISVMMDQIGKKILFRVSQLDDRLATIEEYLARLETEESEEKPAAPARRTVPLRKAG